MARRRGRWRGEIVSRQHATPRGVRPLQLYRSRSSALWVRPGSDTPPEVAAFVLALCNRAVPFQPYAIACPRAVDYSGIM